MIVKRAILFRVGIFSILCLSLLLGGCHLPGGVPCSESELTYVENLAPSNTVVDSLMPVLTWIYPDSSCYPDHYDIKIFARDGAIHQSESESPNYSVPASAGLQPGHTYWWSVVPNTADHRTGAGQVGTYFSTGPTCTLGTGMRPPSLISPPDGAEVRSADVYNVGKLVWENQMSCWPEGNFDFQISKRSDLSSPIVSDDSIIPEIISLPFDDRFLDCARYYWRVGFEPAGGGERVYSETWSFVLRLSDTACSISPDITPILPERHFPIADVKIGANCRSGPGMDYPVLDILAQGLSLPINGRNPQGTWWQVLNANIQRNCWLAGNVIDLSGDTNSVPVIAVAPPEPTPTDTPVHVAPFKCAQYNQNRNACEANPACKWDYENSPVSPCVNK